MKYTEKKALYESIMKEVGRTVKKRLNEDEELDRPKWLADSKTARECVANLYRAGHILNIDSVVYDKTGDYYLRVYGSTLKIGKRFMDRFKKPNFNSIIYAIVIMDQYQDLLYSGEYNPFRDSFKDVFDVLADRSVKKIIEIFEMKKDEGDVEKNRKKHQYIQKLPDYVRPMISWLMSKY